MYVVFAKKLEKMENTKEKQTKTAKNAMIYTCRVSQTLLSRVMQSYKFYSTCHLNNCAGYVCFTLNIDRP